MSVNRTPSWLLLQHISLRWKKDCRGGDHASQRSRRSHAYPLPAGFFDHPAFSNSEEAFPFHQHASRQTPQGFRERSARKIGPVQKAVGAVIIHIDGEEFKLDYDDGLKGGAPGIKVWDARLQSYLAPLRHSIPLKIGEYARIAYNSRMTDWDTGEWWYEIHIVNALAMSELTAPLDVFCSREPDKQYEKISALR